ncbi:MAG: nuclear transport factor 2 family protein [Acidobacteriota bacterium]
MKQSFAMITLILVLPFIAFGQTSDKKQSENKRVEQDLIQLNQQWAELAVRGDVAAFDRITTDDHITTLSSGRIVTRDEERRFIADASTRPVSITADDVKVLVYGDTAIIIGRVTVKRQSGAEGQYRYTTVWVKRQNRWQITAEQFTASPAQPSSQQQRAS